MTRRFWLLGASGSLESAGQMVARVFGVELEPRDSSYLGGDYLRGRGGGISKIMVQRNFVDEDGVLAEPDYPQFEVLVYVTEAERDPESSPVELPEDLETLVLLWGVEH